MADEFVRTETSNEIMKRMEATITKSQARLKLLTLSSARCKTDLHGT